MLIYLPFDDPHSCAEVLDSDRLLRQQRHCLRVVEALLGPDSAADHAGVQMWKGYLDAVAMFGVSASLELVHRQLEPNLEHRFEELVPGWNDHEPEMPWWMGVADLHVSHRALLKHLDQEYYDDFFPEVRPAVDIVWPVD